MDFYLWGYLKSDLRKTKAKSLAELKRALAEAVRAISTDTCVRVIRKVEVRAELCKSRKRGHVENGM